MKIPFYFLLSMFCLNTIFAHSKPNSSLLSIDHHYVYMPVKGSNTTAGYGTLINNTDKDLTLSIVKADGFQAVELHETVLDKGKIKMKKLETIAIGKNKSFEFKPGGHHIMLFDPNKDLKENETIEVTFKSEDQQQFVLPFKIKKRGDTLHAH